MFPKDSNLVLLPIYLKRIIEKKNLISLLNHFYLVILEEQCFVSIGIVCGLISVCPKDETSDESLLRI